MGSMVPISTSSHPTARRKGEGRREGRKNTPTNKCKVIDLFDYCFAENGLTAYRLGEALPSNNFIEWLGEEKYKKMASFILHHIADLDIPIKRYELLPSFRV